jgi:hypothetical protein
VGVARQIGDQTTARWRNPSGWSSRLQSNQSGLDLAAELLVVAGRAIQPVMEAR